MANFSGVSKFLLEDFADVWQLRLLLSTLFLLIYLATLLGNFIIITVTTIDRNLHTPMYFFLRNLSILDMCYISVTVPNACINSFTNNKTISVSGCAIQVFSVFFCASVELLFLTIMAQDRYVAICQPLRYPVIMNYQFCVQTTLSSILIGIIFAAIQTGNTFRLSFCQSNMVSQFFCDIPSLLRLSCSDTFSSKLLLLLAVMGFAGGCFIFIGFSYVRIFLTVLKFPIKEERGGKAFSTCVPHLLVVSVFLSTGSVVYLRPTPSTEMIQNMILSVFYTIVPPFLNPIIYSLRNKQIKEAIGKVILKIFILKNINT
ncbi:olfactory receptor 14C36-like [Perognathus longimembris pacificus]|uniref:olfactory receptor 14C36-like n=1 Tax=Perognathus longimembris pacificus TaxID=214514 RepID=UPI002018FDE9|nr:olfactory receptor 14C36-like [Perognathus longimembris pacificus]